MVDYEKKYKEALKRTASLHDSIAMQIPEKIYISDFGSELSYDWHTEHCFGSDIEYIRTDAFIEKADKFISTFFHPDDKELIDAVLKGFHKHMKGE